MHNLSVPQFGTATTTGEVTLGGGRGWARLDSRLRGSFAGAVAADLDGNGRTDIAFDDGAARRYSRDGRSP